MQVKQLNKSHEKQFSAMMMEIRKSLENPLWFMSFTEQEQKEMLAGKTIITYGAFSDDGELMAVSGLFPNPDEFKDITELLKLNPNKTTELGGCMTLPKFRGHNLMLQLNEMLLKVAKEAGFSNMIATAHPDNIASNKSLKALGMKLEKTITRNGKYLRNVYLLNLTQIKTKNCCCLK